MKRQTIYAWVCFIVFLTLLVGIAGSERALEINDYNKAVISYYGSSGQEVINIQRKLKSWGYYTGAVDGSFGYETYRAVRYFQYKNGLTVDGVAGRDTLAAMGIFPAPSTPSNQNLDLIAHVIYGEARGEPYEGQVAIGAVILNRINDSRFPSSVPGVVYQPGAFTCVDDGQINLEPDSTAIQAATDAINGWDPTYGCVYYYNPSTATSAWIWSRPIIVVIGRHNFAK